MTTLDQVYSDLDAICAAPGTEGRRLVLPGWCKPDKARRMFDLIVQSRPDTVVEIGIFGGRSLIAQAMALRHVGHGVAIGIEPWTTEAALVGADPRNASYWATVNMAEVRSAFFSAVDLWKLQKHCVAFVGTNTQFATMIEGASGSPFIDILHIDGNHTEGSSWFDHSHFLPLVKVGGYIWLDDPGWSEDGKLTQTRGIDLAKAQGELVEDYGDCLLFRKLGSPKPTVRSKANPAREGEKLSEPA